MARFASILMMLAAATAVANESPVPSAGGGGMNPLEFDLGYIFWRDNPNLEGLIGSSEEILELGLRTEIASDFMAIHDMTPCIWFWWGGYFSYAPGDPLVESFLLRFYDDQDGMPGSLLSETVTRGNADECCLYNQGDGFPVYEYRHWGCFAFVEGSYWFSVQAGGYPFPPQWGRLAAVRLQGRETVFRSDYFAFPEWVPAGQVFGEPYDASLILVGETNAIEQTTWGNIKQLFE